MNPSSHLNLRKKYCAAYDEVLMLKRADLHMRLDDGKITSDFNIVLQEFINLNDTFQHEVFYTSI